jgi:hypothetical protein
MPDHDRARAMDEPDSLRVRPAGLYPERLRTAPARLHWTPGCMGQVLNGTIDGITIAVVGGPTPRGTYAVRWVAPRQDRQPVMHRRSPEAACALAERVLRLKGRIA